MKKRIVIFYERHYFEFIRNSIAHEVEIVGEYCISCAKDIEHIFENWPMERDDNETYIGYAIDKRTIKDMFLTQCHRVQGGDGEGRILDIYKVYMAGYSKNYYQRIMNRKINEKLDGLILGISHGMAGIIEEKMPGNACNLCYSSQDIYFNYLTLKRCYEEYYYEIKDLKYVVIDMFDYFYFNFDTILSGAYDRYFEATGFLCEERAPWNKSQSVDEINEIFSQMWQEGKSVEEQELFTELFPFARQNDNGVYKNNPVYDWFLKEEDVIAYKRTPSIATPQQRVFDHTINFQIDQIKKLLGLLQKINPQIKVFMVLLPKYIEVEKAEKPLNELWKKLFMKIIMELKTVFAFEFLDFKEYEPISGRMDYYGDLTHLNFHGAEVFTEYLANILKEEYGL